MLFNEAAHLLTSAICKEVTGVDGECMKTVTIENMIHFHNPVCVRFSVLHLSSHCGRFLRPPSLPTAVSA